MPLFRPATRQKVKLRMAIDGVSGSGKTFTALRFATSLGARIAVINTESGAVEKYLGLAPDGVPFNFDVCELADYSPTKYTEAILAAGAVGYDVVVVDSLSHAWAGAGGALELKDRKGGNSFTAWKDITPMHNQMIEAILHSPCHVIATMRSKTEYVLETNERGQSVPKKMGMAPVQRAGMEYEFDLYCSIDSEHIMRVSKSRCPDVADQLSVKPGASFMVPVLAWLNDGSTASADKFAVTEADLRRLAKVEAADLPPPPKKTAQELMAEAAAKVNGQPGEVAGVSQRVETAVAGGDGAATAAADAPSLADQPPVPFVNGETRQPEDESTEQQRAHLAHLFRELGVDADQQTAILQKRGLSVIRSLSFAQADEIIAKLEPMLVAKLSADTDEACEAAEAVTVASSQAGADESGVVSGRNDGPCTDLQVMQIKSSLVELEQSKPGVTADCVARLNGAGFAKFAELTFAQASELQAAIDAQNIANFFEGVLATAAAG